MADDPKQSAEEILDLVTEARLLLDEIRSRAARIKEINDDGRTADN